MDFNIKFSIRRSSLEPWHNKTKQVEHGFTVIGGTPDHMLATAIVHTINLLTMEYEKPLYRL